MQHANDNSMHHNPVQPPTFNTTKRPSGHLQPVSEPLTNAN